MYLPTHFRHDDRNEIFDFIEAHSFGLLVSQLDGEHFATHLPLLVDRELGAHGTLLGHVAKANPHWRTTDAEVLAVFSGPHAYISPTWYEAPQVVPTWNYLAVHAYGKLSLATDQADTLSILRRMVDHYERGQPTPWRWTDADEYLERMAAGIVAFRISISRLEGKWKLGQNHTAERRENVIRHLREQPNADSQAIAELMSRELRQRD